MENGANSRSMNDTPRRNGEGDIRTYVVSLAQVRLLVLGGEKIQL